MRLDSLLLNIIFFASASVTIGVAASSMPDPDLLGEHWYWEQFKQQGSSAAGMFPLNAAIVVLEQDKIGASIVDDKPQDCFLRVLSSEQTNFLLKWSSFLKPILSPSGVMDLEKTLIHMDRVLPTDLLVLARQIDTEKFQGNLWLNASSVGQKREIKTLSYAVDEISNIPKQLCKTLGYQGVVIKKMAPQTYLAKTPDLRAEKNLQALVVKYSEKKMFLDAGSASSTALLKLIQPGKHYSLFAVHAGPTEGVAHGAKIILEPPP